MSLLAGSSRWARRNRTSASSTAARSRGNSVEHHHFELPRLRELARRALPQVFEAILIPLGLFYAALSLLGPRAPSAPPWPGTSWPFCAGSGAVSACLVCSSWVRSASQLVR